LEAQALLREALIWAKTNNLPHFFRWLVGGLSTLLAYALAENVEADYARELASAWRVKPPSRDTPGWPWPVKLHTLGRFAIELDDQPIIFGRKTPKKDLALLKLLTAAGSKGWPEAKIKDELWPDLDGDRAGNSLKQSLHRLRDLLKDHDAIESKDGSLALNRQRVWCDAWAFDAFSSKQLALNGDAEVLRKQGQRLLALYPGNFLDDDAELPFLVSARERLRAAFVEQVSQIARHLEQAGEFADTLELFRKALEVDSNIEAFYQGAMRCQLKLGRFAEGLAVYERLRRVLLSQWKTEPSMASKALAERLHAGEPLI
jgi:LuxR family maltose regulon positive regulatory protein